MFNKLPFDPAPIKEYSFKSDCSASEIYENLQKEASEGNLLGAIEGNSFKFIGEKAEFSLFRPQFSGTITEKEGRLSIRAKASMLSKTRSLLLLLNYSVLGWMAHSTFAIGMSIYKGSPDIKLVTLIVAGVFMLQAVKEVSKLGWNSGLDGSEKAFLNVFN